MEKDINLIVDVEPNEADLLVRLIEVLLDEWYIRRHEREDHMQKVIAAAKAKDVQKTPSKP
jgi:quinol monooxygenase YgiN